MNANPEEFRTFIRGLLERALVKPEHVDAYTSPENMKEWQIAFTHPSASKISYQYYEFVGDQIVNQFVVFYITDRYPKIVNVNWLTKIAHMLNGEKTLARLTRENTGLEKFIIYGDEMKQKIADNPDLNRNREYIKMCEDTFESFCGCLVKIIMRTGKLRGSAIEVAYRILDTFYNGGNIDISYERVFDPISRLKEMYENKRMGIRWTREAPKSEDDVPAKVNPYVIKRDPSTKKFRVDVYGWPLGDKSVKPENRVLLGTGIAPQQNEAKKIAAVNALKTLDTAYGIREAPPDPYVFERARDEQKDDE
jgi:dsRNA-specific ribonuclease